MFIFVLILAVTVATNPTTKPIRLWQKAHFQGDIWFLFGLDFKVFFEENSEMSLFLLSAIYLHVNKD
jgi:hypothetical protein